MHEEITRRVIQVIAKNQHLDPAGIEPESTFLQLGIDSLDGLHLLFALEEEFGIDIPDDVARGFTSIQGGVECVLALMAMKPAQA